MEIHASSKRYMVHIAEDLQPVCEIIIDSDTFIVIDKILYEL